jgi:hypothetical protein
MVTRSKKVGESRVKATFKEEFMIVSDNDCETVFESYEAEVERQMKWVMSHPDDTQTVRVYQLLHTAIPKTTIEYK